MAQRSDVRVENLRRANEQLASELRIERKPVSESCSAIKGFCNKTRDPLVVSVWGRLPDSENRFREKGGGCSIL